jgi:hypothetical protein
MFANLTFDALPSGSTMTLGEPPQREPCATTASSKDTPKIPSMCGYPQGFPPSALKSTGQGQHHHPNSSTVCVMSEDKRRFLRIPSHLIEPTIGYSRYLSEPSKKAVSMNAFKFHLCTQHSIKSGPCVYEDKCYFIHSKHTMDESLQGLVEESAVHVCSDAASLADCPYPTHAYTEEGKGATWLTLQGGTARHILIQAGCLYVTKGSLSALLGRPTTKAQQVAGSRRRDYNNSERPSEADEHPAGVTQCTHFVRGWCARGAECNFAHPVHINGVLVTSREESVRAQTHTRTSNMSSSAPLYAGQEVRSLALVARPAPPLPPPFTTDLQQPHFAQYLLSSGNRGGLYQHHEHHHVYLAQTNAGPLQVMQPSYQLQLPSLPASASQQRAPSYFVHHLASGAGADGMVFVSPASFPQQHQQTFILPNGATYLA